MITLDQSRIAAPAFPRDAHWWDRFLPSYITGTVHDDGTITLDVTGVAHPSQLPKPAALVRRSQEQAFLRWLYNLPQLEPAIVEDSGEPCQCWRQPARLHNGHCCFDGSKPVRICHRMPVDMRATANVEAFR